VIEISTYASITQLAEGYGGMSAEDYSFIYVLIFWSGVGGLVGALIGSTKGRAGAGFVLGFLLGIIGWIITAFLSSRVSPQTAAAVTSSNMDVYKQQLKQWAVAEAIRRDPSLAASSDAATLARLEAASQQIMRQTEIWQMQQQAMRPPGRY